ncbi:MAG: bacteriophage holin [Candidatus Zixiibacteriota bacterium]
MRLNLKALALSCGILWALCLFLVTLISLGTGYADAFLEVVASVYPGYSVSGLGLIIGLIYAFVDGAIAALIFGWVYNLFVGKQA